MDFFNLGAWALLGLGFSSATGMRQGRALLLAAVLYACTWACSSLACRRWAVDPATGWSGRCEVDDERARRSRRCWPPLPRPHLRPRPYPRRSLRRTRATPGVNATAALISLEEARAEGRKNTQALLALLDVERAEQDVRALALGAAAPGGLLRQRGRGQRSADSASSPPCADPTGRSSCSRRWRCPPRARGNYDISLSLSQVIYDRARWKQLEQSGATAEATRGQALEQADAAELEAINRFFNLYRSQATIQVLAATVQRSEEQLERARALFQAGRVGRSEELSALVNLGNDRINLVQRRAQLVQDQGQLAIWLARPGISPSQAQDPGILTVSPSRRPPWTTALTRGPPAPPPAPRAPAAGARRGAGAGRRQRGLLPAAGGPGLLLARGTQRGRPSSPAAPPEHGVRPVVLQWDLFNGFSTGAQVGAGRGRRSGPRS